MSEEEKPADDGKIIRKIEPKEAPIVEIPGKTKKAAEGANLVTTSTTSAPTEDKNDDE